MVVLPESGWVDAFCICMGYDFQDMSLTDPDESKDKKVFRTGKD